MYPLLDHFIAKIFADLPLRAVHLLRNTNFGSQQTPPALWNIVIYVVPLAMFIMCVYDQCLDDVIESESLLFITICLQGAPHCTRVLYIVFLHRKKDLPKISKSITLLSFYSSFGILFFHLKSSSVLL